MIFKGNQIHNTFKLPANQANLDVQNVLQQNHEEFQKIKIDADMGFVSTQHLEDFLVEYQKSTYNICRSSHCATRQINAVVFQPAKCFPF